MSTTPTNSRISERMPDAPKRDPPKRDTYAKVPNLSLLVFSDDRRVEALDKSPILYSDLRVYNISPIIRTGFGKETHVDGDDDDL
jgi:hypothetical protein